MTRVAEASRPRAMEDLAAVIEAYNEVTDRLQASHDRLEAEVRRLREELQQKNELLERKNRLAALGEMAAGVAHEIRNPLAGIALYADVLGGEVADRPAAAAVVKKIETAVRGLDAIVTDLLMFTSQGACEKTTVRLGGLLEEAVSLLQPQARSAGVRVEIAEGLGELAVEADPQFRDGGAGIAAEVLPKMFDPFVTTKDTGTGLGLAIVHGIAEAHGGTVTAANNADGRGATITLFLL
jgi:two-component system sensor histidine kinase HydH